jgi:two-component sensor histidine kinase
LSDAASALQKRLTAMARCHSALVSNDWAGAQLRRLVEDELAAYEERITIDGPDIMIETNVAQTTALIVHELATNAAKYGALSNDKGSVRVEWRQDNGRLELEWAESGGPAVRAPERTGFGYAIIKQAAEREFSSEPDIRFEEAGFQYRIAIPLS